jgi:hypothetical protein
LCDVSCNEQGEKNRVLPFLAEVCEDPAPEFRRPLKGGQVMYLIQGLKRTVGGSASGVVEVLDDKGRLEEKRRELGSVFVVPFVDSHGQV